MSLVEYDDHNIPRYVILSHTWGVDSEEVNFRDLRNGTGKRKTGYKKILFCKEQAASDGLQHFWVDTCCIDKSNNTELSEAINSMFRWYQNSSKCYVYLSDVSTARQATNPQSLSTTWEAAFLRSRWFSRGWTLQELIAPASVEFFSCEGKQLGSRESLEKHIHDVTGIPIRALRGDSLEGFRVDERLSWAKHRETKRQEDKVYSLLGIFNIYMPLLYGEGREKALVRLQDEIDKSLRPNRELLNKISHIGDAAYDSYENQRHRSCLTNTRVDLLREITEWATGSSSQYIFWLRGRAGTGKSTIALTIAQSLDRSGTALASFFFKRGGGDLSRSRRMLSTIIYQLAIRSSLFGGFVCDALREYPSLGDFASLSQQYDKLLHRPLQRARQCAPHSPSFVVVLDALDECDDFNDVRLLLHLLGDTQSMVGLGLRVLVTSRPEIPIRLGFHKMKHIAYYELALHDVPRAIVDQDIRRFVAHELAQIKTDRNLPDFWPKDDKIDTITTHADGLFIYAATVCLYINGPWQVSPADRLEQVCQTRVIRQKATNALDEMYAIILANSTKGDFSAEEEVQFTIRLRQVVGSVVLLFDNLSAEELARLLFPTALSGGDAVQSTLNSLHAVLDVPEDLSKPIQILHLSFRDFLVDSARCPDIRFQINQQQVHCDLFNCCLDLMKRSLKKNICLLSGQGVFVNEVSEVALSQHLPPGLRYACRHWTSHAEQGQVYLSNNGPVHKFLQQCCPYWLEVMCLIGKLSEATTMVIQMKSLIDVSLICQRIKDVL
jgi:Heterokaryon incompatibility protein (HET)